MKRHFFYYKDFMDAFQIIFSSFVIFEIFLIWGNQSLNQVTFFNNMLKKQL